jgi:hypothetical protein
VQTILERDGLAGMHRRRRSSSPPLVVEPGTPEAAQAAADASDLFAAPTLAEEGAAAAGGASEPKSEAVPHEAAVKTVSDFRDGQAGASFEDLYARAQAFQPDLAAAGEEIATATGAEFKDAGTKRIDKAREKIARKDYPDASWLTDLARGGFSVATPEQADAVVAELGRRFNIIDEGWITSQLGYQDRKVLVQAPNGVVAEVQIARKEMWAAKKGGGQDLYDAWRSLPKGPEKAAAEAASLEHYAAGVPSDEAWNKVGGTTSGPNAGSNVARQTGSGMAPELATSPASTSFQSEPGRVTANALPSDIESTAGRQSQLIKTTSNTSESNVGPAAPGGNGPSSEKTAAGEQTLIPGVAPVTERQRLEAEAGKPLTGGDAPAGGLFDDNARAQTDIFDLVPLGSRDDGGDARLVTREAAIAEVDKVDFAADLVASCRS